MDIRLNRFIDIPADPMAASFEWFAAQALPRLQSAGGFRGIFFGMDREAGTAAGITFWESEAALRGSERVERAIREEALERAQADPSKGLIDSYRVRHAHRAYQPDDLMTARLARWEGLPPELSRELLTRWLEQDVPVWQNDPAYRGMLLGANLHLGNILMIAIWDSSQVERAVELELASRAWLEPEIKGPLRLILIDTYDVALVPTFDEPSSARPAPASH